ncbi:MAG: methionyl-tRNA formyltransferase [Eubacteriaceae bacterium]|jgi:methionyl-tRNA formyltransferase|nr:methionyl-tRNA formyltransferase [Eubacteriaceae bacterium]
MNNNKIVMMGTTDFAVPALEALAKSNYQVVCVVCQPDRPNGRGKRVHYLPMKQKALSLGIPVFQPEKIREPEAVKKLSAMDADFFVVAAYGQILPQDVLDLPRKGCINIHGSLLPQYRGAAPIHHAIIDGASETGVTLMKMDAGMDTGDMLEKGVLPITDTTTVGEMHDALAELGAKLLIPTLDQLVAGKIEPIAQDDEQATYADKVDKHTGCIDWNQTGEKIRRRINGTDPYPGAYTMLNGNKMKCYSPKVILGEFQGEAGQIIKANPKDGLLIKTVDGCISLGEVQMPGKRRMEVTEFLRGHHLNLKTVLGH